MKARVTLIEVVLDSQEFGSDDEHMVSRVTFDLEIDGKPYPRDQVHVKQTVGSNFKTAPLEVSPPLKYRRGPFNHEAFRAAVEGYYRKNIGVSGAMFDLGGATNVRMQNFALQPKPVTVEFEVSREGGW